MGRGEWFCSGGSHIFISLLILFCFPLGDHVISHLFFNNSLGKGLQWTVRTVFAWKVEVASCVSLINVLHKIRSLVMEKVSMRSLKSMLMIPAAPSPPAVCPRFSF